MKYIHDLPGKPSKKIHAPQTAEKGTVGGEASTAHARMALRYTYKRKYRKRANNETLGVSHLEKMGLTCRQPATMSRCKRSRKVYFNAM